MSSVQLKKHFVILTLVAFLFASTQADLSLAAEHPAKEEKGPAILLVTFGTSVESAQASFRNIEKRVKAAFPKTEVRWAYTSKIIRKKLEKEGTKIDSPEMALARLMDEATPRLRCSHFI